MAYRRSKRYGRRRAIRRRAMRARMRRSAPVSASLKRYIRNAVSRPVEKKLKTELNDSVYYNGAATATGDVIPMLPIVQIGDTSYSRDGRSIHAKRCTLTLTLRYTGVNLQEAPLVVTVWHVRDKQQKSFQAVADNGNTGTYPYDLFHCLLDSVNNPVAPLGDWNEPGQPLNLKRFVIRRKTFRMGPSSASYWSNAATVPAGTLGATTGEGSSESGLTLMRVVRLNSLIPKGGKMLTYRTDGDNYPSNHNEYCFITYMRPTTTTGSTSVSATQLLVNATRRLTFTDA